MTILCTLKEIMHGVNDRAADGVKVGKACKLGPADAMFRKIICSFFVGLQAPPLETTSLVSTSIAGRKFYSKTECQVMEGIPDKYIPFLIALSDDNSSCVTVHFPHGTPLWPWSARPDILHIAGWSHTIARSTTRTSRPG